MSKVKSFVCSAGKLLHRKKNPSPLDSGCALFAYCAEKLNLPANGSEWKAIRKYYYKCLLKKDYPKSAAYANRIKSWNVISDIADQPDAEKHWNQIHTMYMPEWERLVKAEKYQEAENFCAKTVSKIAEEAHPVMTRIDTSSMGHEELLDLVEDVWNKSEYSPIAHIQRTLGLGYAAASEAVDELEEKGRIKRRNFRM